MRRPWVAKQVYKECSVSSWNEINGLFEDFQNSEKTWIFRGQRCANDGLETSLERAFRKFESEGKPRLDLEAGLRRQFQRRAHHYLKDTPKEKRELEWLALMQHYGAPTRLLDWTYSFLIGLYFAIEDVESWVENTETCADTSCSIWALDSGYVADLVKERYPEEYQLVGVEDRNLEGDEAFKKVFGSGKRFVCGVNPFRHNPRLSAQQGVFVCAGDICISFEQNMVELFDGKVPEGRFVKYKIEFGQEERKKVIRRLIRMNITSASLFPGLDGFARSLDWALASPTFLVPK